MCRVFDFPRLCHQELMMMQGCFIVQVPRFVFVGILGGGNHDDCGRRKGRLIFSLNNLLLFEYR